MVLLWKWEMLLSFAVSHAIQKLPVLCHASHLGVACLLWKQGARVRAAAFGNPEKPWDTRADSTFPLACNWSKNDLDHMFDHSWKIS